MEVQSSLAQKPKGDRTVQTGKSKKGESERSKKPDLICSHKQKQDVERYPGEIARIGHQAASHFA